MHLPWSLQFCLSITNRFIFQLLLFFIHRIFFAYSTCIVWTFFIFKYSLFCAYENTMNVIKKLFLFDSNNNMKYQSPFLWNLLFCCLPFFSYVQINICYAFYIIVIQETFFLCSVPVCSFFIFKHTNVIIVGIFIHTTFFCSHEKVMN